MKREHGWWFGRLQSWSNDSQVYECWYNLVLSVSVSRSGDKVKELRERQ